MAKLWIIVGALLLIIEISALPLDSSTNNSPNVYALGTRKYQGTTTFRNPPTSRYEGSRRQQYNGTPKTHHQRNHPQPHLLDQMQGKAIFFADPDVKHTPNRQSNFVRKAGHSLKLSERTVNDTIQEVEEMMKENPHLPRLSRQEVIDIIQNITNDSTVLNSTRRTNQTSESESREDYIRSLMLVMPFNTNNLSDSMIQDLYTKPPITEIINTTSSSPVTTKEWRIVVGDVMKEPQIIYSKGTTITTTETTIGTTTQKPYSSTLSYTIPRNTEKYKTKYTEFGSRQHPKINTETTQEPSTVVEKFTVPRYRVRTTRKPVITTEAQRITPKYRIRTTQRPTTVFQYPESTLARLRAKTTEAPFIVTATSVTAKPFKRIPEEVTIPTPLMTDNIPIRKDVKELLASLGLFPVDHANTTDRDIITPSSKYHTTTIPPPFPVDVKKGADTLSPEMQTLLKSFGLLDNEIPLTKDTATKQTTSQQTSIYDPPPPEPTVDIESYAAFKPLPDPASLSSESADKSKYKMGDDMKDFLVSFGLIDMENTTTSDQTTSAKEQRPRKSNYRSRGRKYEVGYNQRRRNRKKESNSTSPMSLSIDTDMFPDDMKGVLKTLGIPTNLEIQINTTNATNDLLSSTTLKPEITTTIQTSKATTTAAEESTTERFSTTTTATYTTKRIDQNITENEEPNTKTGLTPSITVNSTTENGNGTTEGHIFNPKDAVPNTEDIAHLNKLLKTVRLLANGTTPEELEYILGGDSKQFGQSDEENLREEKMTSLEQAKNPPDPLSFEELVHILNEAKNEVKRQQDSTPGSDGKNATSQPATIEGSESGEGPSVEDLAASFGGTEDEDEESELPAPSSRPNGLYFLLDWNSFLEVGEDNSRVNLRFAPKLGDSRNFLPVAVP